MAFVTKYSSVEKLLHHMAFAGTEVQKSLADIEDRIFARDLTRQQIDRPVFVTSLPRAGTTLLLQLLTTSAGFFSHTYRSMPFVLCPLLWERISRNFRRIGAMRERAHADGMLIGYDSPEAFEEMLWKAFWPRKYRSQMIELWQEDDREVEFEAFFRNHIRKILLLPESRSDGGLRYVSKNNANIARLPLLRKMFPDCVIVIPFRNPLDQSASLLRQHINFLELHSRDAFAKRYMAEIGHYEFGANLRHIAFPGTISDATADPLTLNYWLSYWIRTFRYLLQDDGSVAFLSLERLRARPGDTLGAIADILSCPLIGTQKSIEIRSLDAPPPFANGGAVDTGLAELAADIHRTLLARAVC